ncbi:hypothetical protein SLA2020_050580 [Shorea laevis]
MGSFKRSWVRRTQRLGLIEPSAGFEGTHRQTQAMGSFKPSWVRRTQRLGLIEPNAGFEGTQGLGSSNPGDGFLRTQRRVPRNPSPNPGDGFLQTQLGSIEPRSAGSSGTQPGFDQQEEAKRRGRRGRKKRRKERKKID